MITLYTDDLPRLSSFYEGLDFHVTFRTPSHGDPVHVELTLDRFTIGISTVTAAREDHGLDPQLGGRPVGIVLYCDDVDGEVVRLTAGGAPLLSEPHPFQGGRTRVAWVADPDGNPVHLVQVTADKHL